MPKDIFTSEELENFIVQNKGAVAYFSTPDCNVCKVLKPKLIDFLEEVYPEMKFAYVDLSEAKELSAQQSIFTVPTIIFYLDGKELIRKSRNLSLNELDAELSRPYSLYFEE